ncbi:MAG: peptidylprolyl isomerase, partial [Clostridia bacterium]|nr:peptidylprolyl isomerase [Clostridia bacterium]
ILYQFAEDATDKEAEKAKQKALAEAALKEIEAAADPLEKFLELVEKDSKDTGSNTTGGLYEYVGRGQMVEPFEAWSLDEARKEGDIAVVETEYGYHVMYFVHKHDKPMWQITISQNLASEALTEELEATYETDAYKVADDNAALAEMNTKIYDELKSLYYAG